MAHGLAANPAREVKKLGDRYDPKQCDFYSPEEVEAIVVAAASPQDAAIYRTAAFTGLRMGELIALPARLLLLQRRHPDRAEVGARAHRPDGRAGRRDPQGVARQPPPASRATTSSSPATAASTWTTPHRGAATRTRSSAPACDRLRFHDLRTPSGRSPSTRPRRPGPGVDGPRRRGHHDEVHTTAAAPATRGCSRRRSAPRSARPPSARRQPDPVVIGHT